MSGFAGHPKIEWTDATSGLVALLEPLVYGTAAGRTLVVPQGFESDLESRPTCLPGLIHWVLGRSTRTAHAAILHDFLCVHGPELSPPIERAEADALYREALRSTGHGPISAGTAWLGLRAEALRKWLVGWL